MFDERTEELCKELGIEIWFPPASLRARCDNKMETVRIGNKAGVPSAPMRFQSGELGPPATDLRSTISATMW